MVDGEEPVEWEENSNAKGSGSMPIPSPLPSPAMSTIKKEDARVETNGHGVREKGSRRSKGGGRIMWARRPQEYKFFPCRVCYSYTYNRKN